jgi:hypothetical protein
MRPSVPDVHITDSQDAEFAAYRALASQAVVGLVFALLGPLAVLDPALWAVPMLGTLFSFWALRRIKRDPQALVGRKLAWVGLTLSLLMTTAAPTDWLVCRYTIRNEARQFSSSWLQFLMHDEPHKAHQLTLTPQTRQPLTAGLWNFYRDSARSRRALETYVKTPLVHTLLLLGPRATVRFYETAGLTQEGDNDLVEQVYAVTFEDDGEKKSLLVLVQSLRTKLGDSQAGWQILTTALAKPRE